MDFMDGLCTKFKISKFPGYTQLHFPVNKMYEASLHLKIAKYNDVKRLVDKYVPNSDMWFYKLLNETVPAAEGVEDETDNQEEGTDSKENIIYPLLSKKEQLKPRLKPTIFCMLY